MHLDSCSLALFQGSICAILWRRGLKGTTRPPCTTAAHPRRAALSRSGSWPALANVWRQFSNPLALSLLGLALAVTLSGYGYRLSQYRALCDDSAPRVPVVKLWIEHRFRFCSVLQKRDICPAQDARLRAARWFCAGCCGARLWPGPGFGAAGLHSAGTRNSLLPFGNSPAFSSSRSFPLIQAIFRQEPEPPAVRAQGLVPCRVAEFSSAGPHPFPRRSSRENEEPEDTRTAEVCAWMRRS